VVVNIYRNGILDTTTTTDSNGFYVVTGLNPGDFYIVFELPSGGYVFTLQDQGADDALDSDADPSTGQSHTVAAMKSGDIDLTFDAGMYIP